MRLLNTDTRKLEFFTDSNAPLYTILSHRWGDDEVLFHDVQNNRSYEEKEGYAKLDGACMQAKSQGFQYLWIDTCCIDKTSSAELSEAINSMFRWYQDSTICYVYLVDVDDASNFRQSDWFSRGWTLQELIASSIVTFFSKTWSEIGTKSSMCDIISEITLIPKAILRGAASVDTASVAQRMSWASKRQTTRIEDQAYCLMGLFGINMPMLYGEGELAFIRLQEEIIKMSDDHSIFAWSSRHVKTQDLLAPSPSVFLDSSRIIPLNPAAMARGGATGAITLDNKGIRLELDLHTQIGRNGERLAILPCTVQGLPERRVGIWLRREPGQPEEYFLKLPGFPLSMSDGYESRDYPEFELDSNLAKTSVCIRRQRRARAGLPPIVRAARRGEKRIVEFLLDGGADPNEVDEVGYADAWKSFVAGHHREDEPQWPDAALSGAKGPGRETLLLSAILRMEEELVKLLIIRGADLTVRDRVARSPLILAIEVKSLTMTEWLLMRDVDLDAADDDDRTPLMAAAEKECLEIVQLLLAKGADPFVERHRLKDTRQTWQRALDIARDKGNGPLSLLLETWMKRNWESGLGKERGPRQGKLAREKAVRDAGRNE